MVWSGLRASIWPTGTTLQPIELATFLTQPMPLARIYRSPRTRETTKKERPQHLTGSASHTGLRNPSQ